MTRLLRNLALTIYLLRPFSAALQSPLICEDSIDDQPPFDFNDVPCLLGCGSQITRPTGSLLPGSVNVTDIPYCRLNCVRKDASPAMSSAAPSCNAQCENGNGATPDQLGWCVYWCVAGEQSVVSTTCIPELQYTPVSTTTLATYTNAPDEVVTIDGFTQLPAWSSWYQTQTVIPRSCNVMFGSPSTCIDSASSIQGSTSTASMTAMPLITGSSTTSSPMRTTPQSQMTSSPSSTTGVPGEAEAQASGTASTAAISMSSSNAFKPAQMPLDSSMWLFGALFALF